jgi:hypothetical protein
MEPGSVPSVCQRPAERWAFGGELVDGTLDEVSVFRIALTECQVQEPISPLARAYLEGRSTL